MNGLIDYDGWLDERRKEVSHTSGTEENDWTLVEEFWAICREEF